MAGLVEANEGVEKVPEGSHGIHFGGLLTLPGPAIVQYASFYEALFPEGEGQFCQRDFFYTLNAGIQPNCEAASA